MSFNLANSKQIKLIPMVCTNKENSETVRSAVCAMLKPDCNMFTKGEIINALILLVDITEKDASKALGLSLESIKRKRALLCFSDKERKLILDAGLSEMTAELLSKLSPVTRRFAVKHCTKNKLSLSRTKEYIEQITNEKPSFRLYEKKKNGSKRLKLGFVKDIGIVINSIERAVNTAKNSGFDVKYEKSESEGNLSLSLMFAEKHLGGH